MNRRWKRRILLAKRWLILILPFVIIGVWISYGLGVGGLPEKTGAGIAKVKQVISTKTNHGWSHKRVQTKQQQIKTELKTYLKTVTADGTVAVSFYNLTPRSGSSAAQAKNAAVYQAGDLAVDQSGDKKWVAASTFKLYIAAYLFQQQKQGHYQWTTNRSDGFKRMIVNSENDFADRTLTSAGLDKVNNFVSRQGWYVNFTKGQAAITTSNSLVKVLQALDAGSGPFTNNANQKLLLGYMSKQIYRTGIPTGAAKALPKTTVTDKVGFLDDTNNDAGIVTLPSGQRYILVIMTNGHDQSSLSGFPRIAKITKRVQKIVYGHAS